jgi:hypothetical protein
MRRRRSSDSLAIDGRTPQCREQQAAYDQAYQAGAAAAQQQMPAPPMPTASAPGPVAPTIDLAQLKQLGDLHAAGVLTDEEFTAAKAKLIA